MGPVGATELPVTSSVIWGAVQNVPDSAAQSALTQGIDFFSQGLFLDSASGRKVGLTVIVLLSIWFVRRVLQRVVARTVDDRSLQYRWGKSIAYVTWVIAVLFVGSIWVDGLRQ